MTRNSDVQTNVTIENIEDVCVGTLELTTLKEVALNLSEDEKIETIKEHFAKIIDIIGLDLTDDSLKGTPQRVTRMYVKEVVRGVFKKNRHTKKFIGFIKTNTEF